MTPTRIPRTSGIYRITCTVTGKFYIGSAIDLNKRWRDHFTQLRHNIHKNPKLQAAWNKYGEQSFIFEVLELVLPMSLTAREQYWFNKLNPFGRNGFNIDRIAGSRYGSKASPASCAKMRARMLGKPGLRLGYKASPETIERLKVSHRGKKPSCPPPSFENKTHRPESIEKMRIAKLGHTLSEEGCAKMIASKTGHTYAPEVYANRRKTLIIIEPDGTEHLVTGVKAFCTEHNLDISSLMRVAKGKYSQHKGWKARFP